MRYFIFIIIIYHNYCLSKSDFLYVFACQSLEVFEEQKNAFQILAIRHIDDTLFLFKREEDKVTEYDLNGDEVQHEYSKSTFNLNKPYKSVLWKVRDSILTIGNSNFRINLNSELTEVDGYLSNEFYFFKDDKWEKLFERCFNEYSEDKKESAIVNHHDNYWYLGKIRKASSICLIKAKKKASMNNVIILNPKNNLPVGFRYFEVGSGFSGISHIDLFCVRKCKIGNNRIKYVFENQ